MKEGGGALPEFLSNAFDVNNVQSALCQKHHPSNDHVLLKKCSGEIFDGYQEYLSLHVILPRNGGKRHSINIG